LVSVVISHVICTMALVTLIVIMPVFYSNIRDNITVDVSKVELKEVADYVSNTYGNTYVLVNSTDLPDANITKQLVYLPSMVEGQLFTVRIDSEGNNATGITAYLKDRPDVSATAWLSPGLKVNDVSPLESGGGVAVVGCYRVDQDIFMALGYEGESN
jgi:hypothetical protein